MAPDDAKAQMERYYEDTVAAGWRSAADRQARFARMLLWGGGRPHRLAMRAAHWLGFCFPEGGLVEPGHVWCHWCGMRGRR